MSTYLACFIVCDFKRFPADNTSVSAPKASVPINAYARPGQEMFMKYAHFVGVNVIDFYVKYFNIDYPLPKLGNSLCFIYSFFSCYKAVF